MYMMGCNSNNNDNGSNKIKNISHDSSSTLINRRLKPLLPRKISSSSSSSMTFSLSSSHHPYITNDFITLNHHFAVERYKKEMEVQQQILMSNVSSRWNPTPEQLNSLEDIYRRGIRTPSSEQIQEISSQLRRFGKIEGKNVFYWFQNHKARERQKQRRVSDPKDCQQGPNGSLAKPKSGMMRTSYEYQQTKNWTLPSNSSTLSEEPESIQRAAVGAAESRLADGLITQSVESHEKYQTILKHVTCPMTELSKTILENDKLSNDNNRKLFCRFYNDYEDAHEEGGSKEESQTLELFPLRSNEDFRVNSFGPVKFFEFLPLKN